MARSFAIDQDAERPRHLIPARQISAPGPFPCLQAGALSYQPVARQLADGYEEQAWQPVQAQPASGDTERIADQWRPGEKQGWSAPAPDRVQMR